MKTKKKKYPILAFRVTDEEGKRLRREAEERGVKVSKYVKTILFPPWPLDGKKIA